MTIIKTFYCSDEELMADVDKIKDREAKSFSQLNILALKEYVKNHKSGNNQFTLDTVIKATPAFMMSFQIWKEYYSRLNENEEAEMRHKIEELKGLHYQRFGIRI